MKIDYTKLTRKSFNAEEFLYSKTAEFNRIDNNIYDQEILDNLMVTADKAQEVRDLLGFPVKIMSGYRCEALNKLVGGSSNSQHMKGQAIDFICAKFGTPEEIVKFLKGKIEVDQCLCEGSWIHLSIKKEGNRNQFAYFLPQHNGKRKLVDL